ncbi:bifunctional OST-HTH associated domain/LOTUS-like domain/OST-HTH-LOTUS domain [Babesia duncani]|uniref:Bifunctional OST-HTH associated domain/LOTUS-like domain/OST-HTH-LOTUS domain n=1 Tax=Babesia duncani TaxID=323732 RepID=A0AAD9PJ49_9APIC|nr:bifunctional OST-HTH associated domain/LOTUS-like domain/OST-HTH-LOTUS domain [Babesia duncani]
MVRVFGGKSASTARPALKSQMSNGCRLNTCDSNRSTNCSNSSEGSRNGWGDKRLQNLGPELQEELNAIHDVIVDLYKERIVPSVHEIRRKLHRNRLSLIDGHKLLKICQEDPQKRFEMVNLINDKGSDVQRSWAIALVGKDINDFQNDALDIFNIETIFKYAIEISACSTSGPHDIYAIGGRHLFAEYLQQNGPNNFRRMPLGHIVRIVQAAIDLKILVYRENNLVPVASSLAAARGLTLRMESADSQSFQQRRRMVSEYKRNIVFLLEDRLRKKGDRHCEAPLSLCKLPTVYRQRFGKDLDYTAAGYDKLADLLRKEVPECKVVAHQCLLLDFNSQDEVGPAPDVNQSKDLEEQQVQILQEVTRPQAVVSYPLACGITNNESCRTIWSKLPTNTTQV